jgi:hypothetical protein
LQQSPWSGQQQFPVAQQPSLAFVAAVEVAVTVIAKESQHKPASGQQQLPVAQQPPALAAAASFNADLLTLSQQLVFFAVTSQHGLAATCEFFAQQLLTSALAVKSAQHEPWPGQQQLPVTQQPPPFLDDFADDLALAFALGSQHDPCPGQQQSPVTQQPSASLLAGSTLLDGLVNAHAAPVAPTRTMPSMRRADNLARILELRKICS